MRSLRRWGSGRRRYRGLVGSAATHLIPSSNVYARLNQPEHNSRSENERRYEVEATNAFCNAVQPVHGSEYSDRAQEKVKIVDLLYPLLSSLGGKPLRAAEDKPVTQEGEQRGGESEDDDDSKGERHLVKPDEEYRGHSSDTPSPSGI